MASFECGTLLLAFLVIRQCSRLINLGSKLYFAFLLY